MAMSEHKKYIRLQQRMNEFVKEWVESKEGLPTVGDLSKRFRLSQTAVIEMIDDNELLFYNVGFQIEGFGHATHRYKRCYTVEYWGD